MVTKELIDFIQKSRLFGRSDDDTRKMLAEKGWKAGDIEAGFKQSEFNPAPPEEPVKPPKKSHSKAWFYIIITLFIILLLSVAGYFAYQIYVKPLMEIDISDDLEKSTDPDQVQVSEKIFADNLNSCINYKISFTHPLTGEELEKEILGIEDGKCVYVEQMPNGGKMRCKYSETERVLAAQYYLDLALAESTKTEAEVDLGSENGNPTYIVNDKIVENPLQEFMNTGVCEISGY